MKTKLRAPALVFFLLIGFLWLPVKSAVVVQDVTDTEFNTLTTTYTAAWSVVYRGGGISGAAAEEIRLARNIATPQVGGGSNTLVDNLTWSASNNDLQITINGSGNISARANSITVGALQIIRPFNQILIFLYDEGGFGSTSLTGTDTNTFTVRNMFADGNGYPGQSDVISITNFGSQAPFDLNTLWSPGNSPVGDEQYVQIVAIQNTSIPEPSLSILFGITSLFLFLRKR